MNERIVKARKRKVPVICNPTTGQSLALPKVKTKRVGVTSHFGYDPIDKQFKVLSMISKVGDWEFGEHQVLTLGTGKLSWRMIECSIPHYSSDKGICINGVLYYPAFKIGSSLETYIIVCFDVRSETFSFMTVTQIFVRSVREVNRATLINYNGKLGLLNMEEFYDNAGNIGFGLRILEDAEKQKWSEHTYILSASCRKIIGDKSLDFVGMIGTNEIVLLSLSNHRSNPFYLLYYNIERNTMVRVEIRGLDAYEYHRLHTFLDHVEDVKLM